MWHSVITMKRREVPSDTENNSEVLLSDAELAAISLRLRQMSDAGLRAVIATTRIPEVDTASLGKSGGSNTDSLAPAEEGVWGAGNVTGGQAKFNGEG